MSGVMKEKGIPGGLPRAHSDRMPQYHGVITLFVSSLRVITAGVEGTLVGSGPKAPSGIALNSLPL